jgi:hypothetical protein
MPIASKIGSKVAADCTWNVKKRKTLPAAISAGEYILGNMFESDFKSEK